MGKETVIYSDFNGRKIDKNTPASTITIETPGQDTISFEAYLDEADLKSIQDLPIASGSNGAATPQEEAKKDRPSDDAVIRKQLTDTLEAHLKLTDKAAKEAEKAWFRKNWSGTKASKDDIKKELEQADLAKLKSIVPVDEPDRETLLRVVHRAGNQMNVGVISIVRQLRGEKLPS